MYRTAVSTMNLTGAKSIPEQRASFQIITEPAMKYFNISATGAKSIVQNYNRARNEMF
jgi:hypothetical protein